MYAVVLNCQNDGLTQPGAVVVDLDMVPSYANDLLRGNALVITKNFNLWNDCSTGWIRLPFTGTIQENITLVVER
jgi:hypothetical protein